MVVGPAAVPPAVDHVPADFVPYLFRIVQRRAAALAPLGLPAFHVFADLFLGLLEIFHDGCGQAMQDAANNPMVRHSGYDHDPTGILWVTSAWISRRPPRRPHARRKATWVRNRSLQSNRRARAASNFFLEAS